MQTWRRLFNRIAYNDDPDMILSPAKKNMDRFIAQAMLGTAYGTLSGGIFLSGYLLYLGADDATTSYIPILGSVCGIFLIFFSTMIDRQETRKKLLLTANIICKVFSISVAFVPLVVPEPYQIPVIFMFLVIGQIMAGVNNIAFNTWFNELIPNAIKGRYFSVRQIFCVLVSAVLPILAGYFVDNMDNPYLAFIILFSCAAVVGTIELFVLVRLDDVKLVVSKAKTGMFKAFLMPLKHKKFRMYVLILCLFHFFLYLSVSFQQIYMLRYLEISFTFINVMSTIAFVLQILIFYKFWGRVTDRLGSSFTLVISTSLYALDMLIWFFIDASTIHILLPIIQVIAAIEGSAFTVSQFTRRYEIIPQENRSIYDSFYVCCLGLTLLISPFVGGLLRDWFSSLGLFEAMPFGAFRAVFLVSAATLALLGVFHLRHEKKQENGPRFDKEQFAQLKRVFMESTGLRR